MTDFDADLHDEKPKGKCVCSLHRAIDRPVCGDAFIQNPRAPNYIEHCNNRFANGSRCGHDRACHSPASPPEVRMTLADAKILVDPSNNFEDLQPVIERLISAIASAEKSL